MLRACVVPKLDIEFTWPVAVAGYRVAEPADGGSYLVARGEANRWRNPVAENPDLFRRFALLPETPAGCIEFANEHGLLFGVGYEPICSVDRDPAREPGEFCMEVPRDSIGEWLQQIRRLRRLVDGWNRARKAGETTALDYRDMRSPRLVVDLIARAGKPGLSQRPDCLLSAIDLQFYQAVAGMTDLRECEECGDWFECGPGGGRRTVSRFCTSRCRDKFHNKRRSKGGSR
jgi:hypothetical protein